MSEEVKEAPKKSTKTLRRRSAVAAKMTLAVIDNQLSTFEGQLKQLRVAFEELKKQLS